ncbi:MAG TPA: SMR family transporter [Parvibaculum sp.]|uniref:DMT family transporter n=1 Tax=Parvibaculum sp. TaxID=2024848 RepID=UPI002D13F129|nr:SMR family transporter [Parvibaculum sp.]HMM14310.1 SMR family transporter [Parvibaculum sp.]
MAWTILMAASVSEIIWTYTLKASEGFTRPGIAVLNVAVMVLTTWLLSLATKSLPLGTAYPVWTGVGIVGTVIVGIVVFGEEMNAVKAAAVALIVAGALLLMFAEG